MGINSFINCRKNYQLHVVVRYKNFARISNFCLKIIIPGIYLLDFNSYNLKLLHILNKEHILKYLLNIFYSNNILMNETNSRNLSLNSEIILKPFLRSSHMNLINNSSKASFFLFTITHFAIETCVVFFSFTEIFLTFELQEYFGQTIKENGN